MSFWFWHSVFYLILHFCVRCVSLNFVEADVWIPECQKPWCPFLNWNVRLILRTLPRPQPPRSHSQWSPVTTPCWTAGSRLLSFLKCLQFASEIQASDQPILDWMFKVIVFTQTNPCWTACSGLHSYMYDCPFSKVCNSQVRSKSSTIVFSVTFLFSLKLICHRIYTPGFHYVSRVCYCHLAWAEPDIPKEDVFELNGGFSLSDDDRATFADLDWLESNKPLCTLWQLDKEMKKKQKVLPTLDWLSRAINHSIYILWEATPLCSLSFSS